MSRSDTTEDERRGLGDLWRSAKRMTASPLVYVGAITIALATEFVERVVAAGLLSEFAATLALFPVTLVLLYAQLLALAYLRPDRPPGPTCGPDPAGE